jgi:predicted nucleotidyltransferase
MHPESDIDLAIYPDTPGLRKKKLSILTELARVGFCNVDLVFMKESDIVLQYEAVRQNIVVYHAPGFDRGSTYSKIVRQYLDFYPYLAEQRKEYKKRMLNG